MQNGRMPRDASVRYGWRIRIRSQSVHLLVKEYELGGIAEWVLGNQQDWVWEIISANIA